jgi:5-(carboxyamino)imidazole ribonucleotide synthase
LKTRTLGYDGKGPKVLQRPQMCGTFAELGTWPVCPGFVPFNGSVVDLCAWSRRRARFYPLVHSTHEQGLRLSIASSQHPAAKLAELRDPRAQATRLGVMAFRF